MTSDFLTALLCVVVAASCLIGVPTVMAAAFHTGDGTGRDECAVCNAQPAEPSGAPPDAREAAS